MRSGRQGRGLLLTVHPVHLCRVPQAAPKDEETVSRSQGINTIAERRKDRSDPYPRTNCKLPMIEPCKLSAQTTNECTCTSCYDCNILICCDCTIKDHLGHKYEFVKVAVPEGT